MEIISTCARTHTHTYHPNYAYYKCVCVCVYTIPVFFGIVVNKLDNQFGTTLAKSTP